MEIPIDEKKKAALKGLITRLLEGESPEQIKEEFKERITRFHPDEIARIKDELINEGMPKEVVQRFSDIHITIFRETLEAAEPIAPAGHPVNILMEEHRMLIQFAGDLRNVTKELKVRNDSMLDSKQIEHVTHLVEHFKASESHYLREENILFPFLEKHGVTGPTKIMWAEHDEVHELERTIYTLFEQHNELEPRHFIENLGESALAFAEKLSSHFYKENNILFPAALRLIEENEWVEIRQEFDELGYCCFTPELPKDSAPSVVVSTPTRQIEGVVPFETGPVSTDVVEAIMNTLPVDVTFVDANDRVRYFSQGKERIFVRTKAIIGRTVQACHPSKSYHVVNQILEDFKTGKRDSAEFWIQLEGKFIHIRYFSVHSKSGEYLGCLEVSQDITDIKKLEGEKKLLDG